MKNRRDLRTSRGTRKVIPDLWESVLKWDNKTSERLERIGIKNASRKQTRSLLAQFINDTVDNADIQPLKGKTRRNVFLILKRK